MGRSQEPGRASCFINALRTSGCFGQAHYRFGPMDISWRLSQRSVRQVVRKLLSLSRLLWRQKVYPIELPVPKTATHFE